MGMYSYSALSASGRKSSGFVEADSHEAARRILVARGETPTNLRPASAMRRRAQMPRGELSVFLADLAALHDAGVPLRRALDVLADGASTPRAAQLARLMSERLDAGSDFGRATRVEDSPDIVFAAELARAGETSGKLGDSLRFASELLRKQSEFTRRISNALAYPAFLVVLSLFAIIALTAFAGPAIAPLLEDAPNPPQGLTFILAAGEVLQRDGLVIAVVVTVLIIILVIASQRSPLRDLLATARAKAPFLGSIVRDINCGAFSRTLGALLSGGTPAATAMELASRTVPNSFWRKRFGSAALALRDGRTVHGAISALPEASPEIARLARVGEQSGTVGDMLTRAGNIALERALRRLDQAAAAAGPLLILAMGGFTGWLMSAFLTGLSQLGEGSL